MEVEWIYSVSGVRSLWLFHHFLLRKSHQATGEGSMGCVCGIWPLRQLPKRPDDVIWKCGWFTPLWMDFVHRREEKGGQQVNFHLSSSGGWFLGMLSPVAYPETPTCLSGSTCSEASCLSSWLGERAMALTHSLHCSSSFPSSHPASSL